MPSARCRTSFPTVPHPWVPSARCWGPNGRFAAPPRPTWPPGRCCCSPTGPGPLAGLLALPYLANVLPYANLERRGSARAHAGWVRFLWLNYVTGFFVTMLLIWYALVR